MQNGADHLQMLLTWCIVKEEMKGRVSRVCTENMKSKYNLDNLLKHNDFEDIYVLSCNNVEEEDGITYLPIYMTGLICGNDKNNIDYSMPPVI